MRTTVNSVLEDSCSAPMPGGCLAAPEALVPLRCDLGTWARSALIGNNATGVADPTPASAHHVRLQIAVAFPLRNA